MPDVDITKTIVENKIEALNFRVKSGPYQLFKSEKMNVYALKNKKAVVSPVFNSLEEIHAYIEGLLHREFM